MKKFFTLIAAVALAASVNAQTFKSFEKTTVLLQIRRMLLLVLLRAGLLKVVERPQQLRLVVLIRRLVKKRYISSLVLI